MATEITTETRTNTTPPGVVDIRFVNAMRLCARLWLAVAVIVTIVLVITPSAMGRPEEGRRNQ